MLIREASFPSDSERLKSVILEYVKWLDMDISYRGFAEEMEKFDGLFTLPHGLFLLAEAGQEIAGCVGLLRHTPDTAEVKRLYVRSAPYYPYPVQGTRFFTRSLQSVQHRPEA